MKVSYFMIMLPTIIFTNTTNGGRTNLVSRLIQGYKISPIIGTSIAASRLVCAAACLQNEVCDVYSFKTTAGSDNCDIAVLNAESFFEEDPEYQSYIPDGAVIPLRNRRHGLWGIWSSYFYCAKGSFIYGIMGWEDHFGGTGLAEDDCGMTGIRLYCKDLLGKVTSPITFNTNFSDAVQRSESFCPQEEFASGYEIRWAGNKLSSDDDAMTNLRLYCQTSKAMSYDNNRGMWRGVARCPTLTYICGFRVLYEKPYIEDDTCFNEVMVVCCFYV